MNSLRRDALMRAAVSKQPPPGGGGTAVFNVATQFVGFDEDLVEALHARSEKGQAKYHQTLKTLDGRNSSHEQLQKALDGFVYAVKDHLEGPGSLAVVAAWIRVLSEVSSAVAAGRGWETEDAANTLRTMGMTSAEVGVALGLTDVSVRRIWSNRP